jgi:hypothetical protein
VRGDARSNDDDLPLDDQERQATSHDVVVLTAVHRFILIHQKKFSRPGQYIARDSAVCQDALERE